MSDERLPKVMLFGELKMENEQAGPQGRPPKNWRQCLYDDLNAFEIEIETWRSKAADAETWQALLMEASEKFMKRKRGKKGAAPANAQDHDDIAQ